jgi:hypothetical protein
MDRRFIRRCLGFQPVYQLVRRFHRRLIYWYRRFIRRCFFLLSCSVLTLDLLILACGILASLGPRSVYKDMLNNKVSPNDHVVMNHQNQTRTNGIWGHVRYKLAQQVPLTKPRRRRRQGPTCRRVQINNWTRNVGEQDGAEPG